MRNKKDAPATLKYLNLAKIYLTVMDWSHGTHKKRKKWRNLNKYKTE
jgi:hypothetical protein